MWVDKLKAAQVLSSLNTDTPTHTQRYTHPHEHTCWDTFKILISNVRHGRGDRRAARIRSWEFNGS